MTDQPQKKTGSDDIAAYAETSQPGAVRSLFSYMCDQGKWFLAPIIIILLLAGMFLLLSGSAIAPFIYTLF